MVALDDPALHRLYVRQTSEEKVRESLNPTHDQQVVLWIILGYTLGILILWNLPYLKHILKPFKLLVVALHEFSHAIAGCMTCAKIKAIKIDPDEGGSTEMTGGVMCITLPAGYLGSSLIGALLIFCSFNLLATMCASIFLGVCLLITLWWARSWLLAGIGLLFLGLMVFLWWLEHGVGLKYLVLFIGVMSCLYSLWDIMDDLVFRKAHQSDATKFAQLSGGVIPSQCWGVIWLLVSFIFLVAGVLSGLAAFKEDQATQESQASVLRWP